MHTYQQAGLVLTNQYEAPALAGRGFSGLGSDSPDEFCGGAPYLENGLRGFDNPADYAPLIAGAVVLYLLLK